ncbi:MAG: hypothetical protein QOI59_481, partial [Gammaproteobacteria bacterium]|nr:hypothetical protein [Gammaproteobacteria bacterium]
MSPLAMPNNMVASMTAGDCGLLNARATASMPTSMP